MSNQQFANNLKYLCEQKPSVAFVCREMEINRQQFNKYLNGSIFPSRHNLKRICEFFDVEKEQLKYNTEEFKEVVNQSVIANPIIKGVDLNQIIDSLPNNTELLDRYLGYYYSYFHALGYPGYIVRSLIQVYEHEGRYYTRSLEHLWDKSSKGGPRNRFKYRGLLMYLADRLFLTEHETLTNQVICHTIIYPNYRSTIDFLSGLTSGVGSLNAHIPKATRVEYRFLGKSVNLREAIAGCGLFTYDSPDINDEIRDRIANDISSNEFMLTARGE